MKENEKLSLPVNLFSNIYMYIVKKKFIRPKGNDTKENMEYLE